MNPNYVHEFLNTVMLYEDFEGPWGHGAGVNPSLSAPTVLELSKAETVFTDPHRQQSPKAKALRTATARRRKRPHAHLRAQHLDEALSAVTTPEDEEVIHRIKHVAGTHPIHYPPHQTRGRYTHYPLSTASNTWQVHTISTVHRIKHVAGTYNIHCPPH